LTLSHALGDLGLLEREGAAILNAALQPLAARLVPQYAAALAPLGLAGARLFLTGSDGALLRAEVAAEVVGWLGG
jgi:N-methylhydantoinase A/oxoprolinase/acetone carboxylase beta subunit